MDTLWPLVGHRDQEVTLFVSSNQSSDRLPAGLKWRIRSTISPCASRRTSAAWLFPCWHSEQFLTSTPPAAINRFISSGYRCEHPGPCGCCVTPGPPEIRGPRIAVAARLGLGVALLPESQFLRAWSPPHPGGNSSIAGGVRRAPPAEQNAPNPVRVIIGDNEVHPGSDQLRT